MLVPWVNLGDSVVDYVLCAVARHYHSDCQPCCLERVAFVDRCGGRDGRDKWDNRSVEVSIYSAVLLTTASIDVQQWRRLRQRLLGIGVDPWLARLLICEAAVLMG